MTHSAGTHGSPPALGQWIPTSALPTDTPDAFRAAIGDLRAPVVIVHTEEGFGVAPGGSVALGAAPIRDSMPVAAYLPPLPAHQLGDPTFLDEHGVRFAYMTGAMANGIGSVEVVEAMSRAGMLGSFGAAGLSLERIASSIDRLKGDLGDS